MSVANISSILREQIEFYMKQFHNFPDQHEQFILGNLLEELEDKLDILNRAKNLMDDSKEPDKK